MVAIGFFYAKAFMTHGDYNNHRALYVACLFVSRHNIARIFWKCYIDFRDDLGCQRVIVPLGFSKGWWGKACMRMLGWINIL